jgi:hypothetical protein
LNDSRFHSDSFIFRDFLLHASHFIDESIPMTMMTMKVTMFVGLFLALAQPLNAWSTFGSGNQQPPLGKKSTALDVLTQLNREEKLAPYVHEGGSRNRR